MLDLVGYLQAESETFTRSEQQLAKVILTDIAAALRFSIIELAAAADVSAPTVTRFCRRIGCDSFSEFKVRLAQSRSVVKRYVTAPEGPATTTEIAHNIVNYAQAALFTMVGSLDVDRVEQAAASLAGAEYILAFGSGGTSSLVANELETRLFRLGLRITASIDHQAQIMRTAGAPRGTVIIASSVSGRNQPLAQALHAGRDYGMTRIVITRPDSLVAREADILLGIDVREADDILRPSPTRYAYLAMIDIIAQTVATRRQQAAVPALARIKHQLMVNRDGDDTQPLGD
ncbi:MurR/RpiR family transcriptional regulator [Devosia sp. CN2-171]|jgi:DNA-binding MurR/RpiR family transcriptional regulator|uniref:MurR/RpiR family transcriptional regulator n=1 Tax=Devosia sp. CN2-171 TaxID=3400909 RepID=UPI003BF88DE2